MAKKVITTQVIIEDGKEPEVVFHTERDYVPVTLVEVINVGLAGRAIEVVFHDGVKAYLQIPESEQEKVRASLKAAV